METLKACFSCGFINECEANECVRCSCNEFR